MSTGKADNTRTAPAPEAILSAAQRLFARTGIDGVSLREIAAAAGNRNVNAVQYHFGGKPELVRAIYARNVPLLDALRARHLAAATRDGRQDCLASLVHCFCQPLVELVDEDGLHTYAAFHAQAVASPVWGTRRIEWLDIAPATTSIVARVCALSECPTAILHERFIHVGLVMAHALAQLDSREITNAMLEDALKVSLGIITA